MVSIKENSSKGFSSPHRRDLIFSPLSFSLLLSHKLDSATLYMLSQFNPKLLRLWFGDFTSLSYLERISGFHIYFRFFSLINGTTLNVLCFWTNSFLLWCIMLKILSWSCFSRCFPVTWLHSLYWFLVLFLHGWRTWHFSLLKFIIFLWAHFSSILRFL